MYSSYRLLGSLVQDRMHRIEKEHLGDNFNTIIALCCTFIITLPSSIHTFYLGT